MPVKDSVNIPEQMWLQGRLVLWNFIVHHGKAVLLKQTKKSSETFASFLAVI